MPLFFGNGDAKMKLNIALKSQSILERGLRSKFVRHVSLMISGTAIAQAITLLAAPLLSRLYRPEELGGLAVFLSLVSLLSVISSLRYEMAIVLPQEEEEAASVFVLSCCILAILTAIGAAISLPFGGPLARLLGAPGMERWMWAVPVGLLATGLYQILNLWSTRRQQYQRISLSQITRSGGISGTQIAAGMAGYSAAGLIAGQIAGQLMASIWWALRIWRESSALFKSRLKLRQLKQIAWKYSEFPKYSTPQTLLNALSQNLPIFLLGFFYGAVTVGFYSIALRLIQLPVTLVSQSVRQVFYQRTSAAGQGEVNLHEMLKKTTLSLALIALLPSLCLILFGSYLFQWVLGADWAEAGLYASWIVTWLFFAFINPPAIVATTLLGMQKMLLVYECLLLGSRFGALYIGGMYYSAMTCVAIYSLVGVLFNLYLILAMLKASKERIRAYGAPS